MVSKFIATVAAATLVAAPALAAPTNPAASLSVAKSARVGSASSKKSELAGGGIFIAIIAVVAVGLGIYAAVDNDDKSDSN